VEVDIYLPVVLEMEKIRKDDCARRKQSYLIDHRFAHLEGIYYYENCTQKEHRTFRFIKC